MSKNTVTIYKQYLCMLPILVKGCGNQSNTWNPSESTKTIRIAVFSQDDHASTVPRRPGAARLDPAPTRRQGAGRGGDHPAVGVWRGRPAKGDARGRSARAGKGGRTVHRQ